MRLVLVLLLPAAIAQAAPCSRPEALTFKTRLTADAVEVCFDTCLRLPYATRQWEAGAEFTPVDAPAPEPVITARTRFRVGDRDVVIDEPQVQSRYSGYPEQAAANASRTRIAVVGPSRDQAPESLFLFAADKLVATLHPWKPDAIFSSIGYLGDSVVVTIPRTPIDVQGRIYDGKTGKLIADIGHGAGIEERRFVDLGDHYYAFADVGARSLPIVDAVTGRAEPPIATAAPSAPEGFRYELLAVTPDKKLLVAIPGNAISGVTLIDTKTHKGTRIGVPACTP